MCNNGLLLYGYTAEYFEEKSHFGMELTGYSDSLYITVLCF